MKKLTMIGGGTILLKSRKLLRGFFKLLFVALYTMCCIFPIKKNRILFASDSREDLSGNFSFIYQEIKRQDLDFDCKFMLKDIKRKQIGTYMQLAFYLATSSKIIVDDYYAYVYPLKIRNKVELIQVWHAVGAFKRFGHSRAGLPGAPTKNSKTHRNYTKAIVSSSNVVTHYAEGFGIKADRIKSIGVPRTDIFFNEEYKTRTKKQLREKFTFLKDKKVIMFAPTFRGKGKATAYYPFEKIDFKLLYENLSDDYVFIIKLHPFVRQQLEIPIEYREFFHDFSDYREINDLLLITDVLITDYSSVCFEYALLNKPMLFFAFDVEEYIKDRDFYFNYHDFIPGPLIRNSKDLVSHIQNEEFLMERLDSFVNLFYDQKDGKSSKRFVEEILK
ncbi:CDP-glycerol glycerophosphotransferase family protein [Alkalicoccobacillus gibsonii]|uniref:CDP-glycerol glycerophosphotransferase family protein n=1 Tax=Alkalicoccobacillus gibsonii TaxID=79881 RepID=UPI0035134AC9